MAVSQPPRQGPDTSSSGQTGIVPILLTLLLSETLVVSQVVCTPWQELDLPEELLNKDVSPGQLAVNRFGDLYLVDNENYWLALIPGDGSAVRLSGGWGDEGERFSQVTDIVAAPGLDVILSDHTTHRLLRFDRKLNFVNELNLNSSRRRKPFEYPYRIDKNRWGGSGHSKFC